VLEVNPNEGIGRELVHQNVFDIAVTETAWRLLHPGDVAVDVGANIGYMTSLFAARVGREGHVEAFEPHPRIFARLRKNVSHFGLQAAPAKLGLHECALGSHDGTARLFESSAFSLNEGASTLATTRETVSSEQSPGFEVRVARLDGIITDCEIALLKVDVEGFEGEVFAGARQLLASGKIRNVIYEAHDCERSQLHGLLSGYGYAILGIGHDLFGPRFTPGSAAPRVDRIWESPSYLATLSPAMALSALRARGWSVLHAC
jgi:FkbM family methyltransferase